MNALRDTFPGLVLTLLLLAACPAQAADIYINGKQVRGITNLSLQDCVVTFNARGDVHITAPEFKVLPVAAKGEQTNTAPEQESKSFLKNRYFLFTQTSSPGDVPYHFEVLVNGTAVKSFTSAQNQLTVELTLFLKKGRNDLEIRSLYQQGKAGSAADSYAIFIGRGAPNHGSLEINKVLVNYTRKGSDSGDATDLFHIEAE